MSWKMIVLTVKGPGGDFELAGAKAQADGGRAQPVSVGVVDTRDAQDRRELRADKRNVACAPPMPVRLITSIASAAGVGGQPPGTSWGIGAVGAPADEDAGAGVTVAVLDTGIDANHAAFAGVELVCKNFTTAPDGDTDGHGTHCAGTIFGRDVDGSRIGIARGVSRALIGKVIGQGGGSTETIVRALMWAQSEGARVISMSLGMDFVGYQKWLTDEEKLPEAHAVSMALAGYRDNVRLFDRLSTAISARSPLGTGAVVVAAAGNESRRPQYSVTVAPPAAAESFVPVTAVGQNANGGFDLPTFANEGAMFAAPGVDIWSAQNGGGLVAKSGTSMATPHVAGVAALYAAELLNNGAFSAADVIDSMERDAQPLPGISSNDVRLGLVQAPQAGGGPR